MSKNFRHRTSSQKERNLDWKTRIWSSNIFSILLIVILIVSFVKVGKELMLRWEINQEIQTLEDQLADLEGKANKMESLISYLQTDEYIEKQARLELNLSKPGEKQVNINSIDLSDIDSTNVDDRTSMQKWFNYFFD